MNLNSWKKAGNQIIMNLAAKNPGIEENNDKTPDNLFFLITGHIMNS